MSETEKLRAAIETLQKQDFGALFVRLDDGTAYALDVAVEEAITALREKLLRDEPKTCDGCRYRDDYSPSACDSCERNEHADRYEPKGERT